MITQYKKIKIETARRFTSILLILIVVYQLMKLIQNRELNLFLCLLAAGLIIIYIFFPGMVKALFWFFSAIAGIIGTLLSYLILTLVFFFLIFPLGTIRKLLGKSPVTTSFDPSVKSYWLDHESVKNDMRKQY